MFDIACSMSHREAEIAMGKMKERELGRQREGPVCPPPTLYLYTPKTAG